MGFQVGVGKPMRGRIERLPIFAKMLLFSNEHDEHIITRDLEELR